jgi:hypothetical protein
VVDPALVRLDEDVRLDAQRGGRVHEAGTDVMIF